jgi:hypothetical protein
MQAAQVRDGTHAPGGGRLHDTRLRRVARQRQVRPCLVIVGQKLFDCLQEVALVEDEQVIEALPPQRAEKTLDIWVLPRRPRRGDDLLDVQRTQAVPHLFAIGAVPVPDQVLWHRVEGEGLAQLPRYERGRRMRGHVDVDAATALVSEDHEHVEQLERHGRDHAEIDGRQRAT